MNPGCCKEYMMGFCPYEEFYVEAVTEKCPFAHVSADREEYRRECKIYPFEYNVLEYYKNIIEEVEKKIKVSKWMLNNDSIDEKYLNALYECERLIDLKNTENFDFSNTHSLLILHGKMITNLKNSIKDPKKEVCKNCSALKEISRPCTHNFCKKYEKLRNLIKSLDLKLPKKERFIE